VSSRIPPYAGVSTCQEGVAAIEFSIIIMVFLVILVGIISFGALFWMQQKLAQTAGEAARTALYARMEGTANPEAAACAPANAAFEGDGGFSCKLTQANCTWPASGTLTYTCGTVVLTYNLSMWAPLSALRALIAIIPAPDAENWIPASLGAQANVQIWQAASP
jgi:Flp pilus assembly protein TadG